MRGEREGGGGVERANQATRYWKPLLSSESPTQRFDPLPCCAQVTPVSPFGWYVSLNVSFQCDLDSISNAVGKELMRTLIGV